MCTILVPYRKRPQSPLESNLLFSKKSTSVWLQMHLKVAHLMKLKLIFIFALYWTVKILESCVTLGSWMKDDQRNIQNCGGMRKIPWICNRNGGSGKEAWRHYLPLFSSICLRFADWSCKALWKNCCVFRGLATIPVLTEGSFQTISFTVYWMSKC